MDVIIFVLSVFFSFFETFVVMEILFKLFGAKILGKHFYVGFIFFLVFSAGASALTSRVIPIIGVSAIFGFAFLMFFSALLLKGKFYYKLISIIIMFMLSLTTDLITAQVLSELLGMTPKELVNSEQISRVMLIIISKCLYFIISRFFLFFKNKKLNQYSKGYWWIFGIVSAISLAIMMFASSIQLNAHMRSPNTNVFIISFIFLIFIVNIVTYYLILKISKDNLTINRNNLINQHNNMMINQYKEMVNSYEKLKRVRHDFSNHLLFMESYIQKKNYDKLQQYIGKIKDEVQYRTLLTKTGNDAIDTILDFKLALAIQKGIDVNIIGVAPQSLNINDYDLCCILTNIIDNAIESCELMRRGNEKKIKCNFSVYKGFLKIEITNSVESYNPSFLTKKKDKNLHGLGLEIIKIVVEKNNGFCYFGTDNNIFRSKVLLNL